MIIPEIRKTLEQYEGGYVNDPDDKGGETKYGISKRSYPTLDIPSLTIDQAADIAKKDYYDRLSLSGISSQRVRWKLFDIAFNMGTSVAARFLQHALRVTEDGIIGTQTLAAANAATPAYLVNQLVRQQVLRYCGIVNNDPTQAKFLSGWAWRALDFGDDLDA